MLSVQVGINRSTTILRELILDTIATLAGAGSVEHADGAWRLTTALRRPRSI